MEEEDDGSESATDSAAELPFGDKQEGREAKMNSLGARSPKDTEEEHDDYSLVSHLPRTSSAAPSSQPSSPLRRPLSPSPSHSIAPKSPPISFDSTELVELDFPPSPPPQNLVTAWLSSLPAPDSPSISDVRRLTAFEEPGATLYEPQEVKDLFEDSDEVNPSARSSVWGGAGSRAGDSASEACSEVESEKEVRDCYEEKKLLGSGEGFLWAQESDSKEEEKEEKHWRDGFEWVRGRGRGSW